MDIATAKQVSDFYVSVRSMIALINQGAGLNAQCQAVTNAVAADLQFAQVLSADEQAWVTQMATFFNSLAAQLPPIPATIIAAVQS
jgi:hypothetical protein